MSEIIEKLAQLQANLNAPKNKRNNFGKYNYRTCEDILAAAKKVMPEGSAILLNDEIVEIGERIYVKATASFHAGSETIKTTALAREQETKKGMDEAQITGAASSYARKYALNGLLAIDDQDSQDPDSKQPQQPQQPQQFKPKPKPQPQPQPTFTPLQIQKLDKYLQGGEYDSAIMQILERENKTEVLRQLLKNNLDSLKKMKLEKHQRLARLLNDYGFGDKTLDFFKYIKTKRDEDQANSK